MKSSLATIGTLILMGSLAACSSTPKQTPAPVASTPTLEIQQTPRGPLVAVDDVLFDFEKATLRAEADSVLKSAADYLNDNQHLVATIEGHTDHTGDAQFNQFLSIERARSVKDALIKYGVSASRMKTDGLGETRPVASNETRDGRQSNRRVEILFSDADKNQMAL